MIISAIPAVSGAEETAISGGFEYKLVSGEAQIVRALGNPKEVVVPSELDGYTVTSIGERAFEDKDNLVSVVLPDTVTLIGYDSFWGCDELNSVTFPKALKTIGDGAFEYCPKLTSAELPDTLRSIGRSAFEFTGLTSFEFPKNINSVGERAFGQTSLSSVVIPDVLTALSNSLFSNCKQLETVTFGGFPSSFGDNAFAACSSLKNIEIPDSVTTIGEGCFNACTSLEKITIPFSVTKIGANAFRNCTSLSELNFEEGLAELGSQAFVGCSSLTKVTLPDSLTTVGSGCFANCTSLTEVNFGKKLRSISERMFAGCTALEQLTIPNSINSIGENAFPTDTDLTLYSGYNSVAKTYALKNGIKFVEVNINPEGVHAVITLDSDKLEIMQYRRVKLGFKVENPGTSTTFTSENEGIAKVDADGYIEGMSPGETAVTVRNADAEAVIAVTVIASDFDIVNEKTSGFYKYFLVEDNELGRYAKITGYSGDEKEISIPEKLGGYPVKLIDESAFTDCASLERLIIPEGIVEICDKAFENCLSLQYIKIPSTLKIVGNSVFPEMLTDVYTLDFSDLETALRLCERNPNYYGSKFPSASDHRLYINGKSAETVTVPEGTKTIIMDVFTNVINVKKVILPKGVETIARYAFFNCSSLETINLPDGLTTVNEYAFSGCINLDGIILPNGCYYMNHAFENTGLTSVTIPGSANFSISCFSGCKKLETVYFNSRIYLNAKMLFWHCAALKSIYLSSSAAIDERTDIFLEMNATPTIYGYAGTSAEDIAKRYGLAYVELTEETEPPTEVGSEDVDSLAANNIYDRYYYDDETETLILTNDKSAVSVNDAEFYGLATSFFTKHLVIDKRLRSVASRVILPNLETMAIRGNVVKITDRTYRDCEKLRVVSLGDSVAEIGVSAFESCYNLENVPFGKGLKVIGDTAFKKCMAFRKIIIPPTVEEIGDMAFADCKWATSAVIPSSVTEIGLRAFGYLTDSYEYTRQNFTIYAYPDTEGARYAEENNFKLVLLDPDEPYPTAETDELKTDFTFENKPEAIPISSPYIYDSNTKTYTLTNKAGASSQPDYDVYNRETKTLVIDYEGDYRLTVETVKRFENIEKLIIRDGVSLIEGAAFHFAGDLEYVELGDCVKALDDECFANRNFTFVPTGKGLTRIGREAFYECRNMQTIKIPETVKSVGKRAFMNCSATSVTIPASVTEIGEEAFGYNVNYDTGKRSKKSVFTIYAPEGSAGAKYARDNGFALVTDGSADEPTEEAPTVATVATVYPNPSDSRPPLFPTEFPAVSVETEEYTFEPQETTVPATEPQETTVPATDPIETAVSTEPAEPVTDTAPAPKLTVKSSLKAGKTATLTVTGGVIKSVKSSKKAVLAVKGKKLTALKKGSSKITVTLTNGKKLTKTVRVTTSPTLSKKSIKLKKGAVAVVKISGKAASVKNVYYSTKKAVIIAGKNDKKIKIRALKRGKTTLKVKVNGVKLSLKVKIT